MNLSPSVVQPKCTLGLFGRTNPFAFGGKRKEKIMEEREFGSNSSL